MAERAEGQTERRSLRLRQNRRKFRVCEGYLAEEPVYGELFSTPVSLLYGILQGTALKLTTPRAQEAENSPLVFMALRKRAWWY